MKKLLPVILLLLGVAVGGGAGTMMKPAPPDCEEAECPEEAAAAEETHEPEETVEPTYVRMKNQFVVPVVRDDRVRSLVVLDLSLQVEPGSEETIYSREPKVRDAFLRVLFDHAHIGGFDGTFTESGRLSQLRVALLEAAQAAVGPSITDILITDIVRQEM